MKALFIVPLHPLGQKPLNINGVKKLHTYSLMLNHGWGMYGVGTDMAHFLQPTSSSEESARPALTRQRRMEILGRNGVDRGLGPMRDLKHGDDNQPIRALHSAQAQATDRPPRRLTRRDSIGMASQESFLSIEACSAW